MTLVGILVAPTFASVGVGTDVAKIDVPQPFAAGGTYNLVSFAVINMGTQASGYGIMVSPSSKPGIVVPASWLSFEPDAFFLYPKQSMQVRPVLHVALDAAPGAYRVQLLGVPKTPDLSPGGHVNVGVGPELSFTVTQPSTWQRVYFTLMGWMPWSAIAALVLAVGLLAVTWLALWRRRIRRQASAGGPVSEPLDGEFAGPDDDSVE